ncbi:tRNA-dihydrouridine synthase [Patescibacteria group bacterium]|nr:tRNA-dihydrouridine synthase [Patescibacteria group bacterium]
MEFSWEKAKRPILALAPMEGYTDSAFRQLIKKFVPGVICFTEFTSADALKYNSKTSFQKLEFNPSEQPLVVQLFGKHPENFIESAKYLEQLGIAAIDINMGCPAKKVIGSDHGSALIKNPDLAAEIVNALVNVTSLPISVKTRIGFSSFDEEKFQKFCLNLEQAGAKLLTIHGRTTKQGFSGKADWEPIYRIKENLKIPVIGNGDIDSGETAKQRIQNLDGVMVGRATFGNPLIMHEIYNALNPENINPDIKLPDWINLAKQHVKLSVATKGEKRAMLEMRKHLAMYVKGFPGASEYRNRLVRIESEKEALGLLNEIKENSA